MCLAAASLYLAVAFSQESIVRGLARGANSRPILERVGFETLVPITMVMDDLAAADAASSGERA